MTCLPLARASILLKRPAYLQLAIAQFLLHAQYLCDTRTGLWFHGWQFDRTHGCNGHNFAGARWARGNCWITLALPMLLELMDDAGLREDGARTYLVQAWRRQVSSTSHHVSRAFNLPRILMLICVSYS
jgi:unsaturated rhamnogalacturonyl hydrolase